jgi:hypothetical protein
MSLVQGGRSSSGPNGLLVSALLALGASGLGCKAPTTTDGLEPPIPNPPVTAPAAVRPISGDSQSAVPGALLPESLVVRVYDSLGDPFPGIAINWTLEQDGQLGAAQTITDATGTAKNSWQLGSVPGFQHALASSAGLTPVTFVGHAIIKLLSIALSPQVVTLFLGGTQQYSTVGTYSDGSTKAVNVTYTATGGTINAQGLYTAGIVEGSFIVVAKASNGLADTATVNLTVETAVLTKIDLNPASITLDRGVAQQFSVAGHMSDGSTIVPQVSYNATGGTITADGLYTSGNSAGTFRVIAVQAGGTLADTAKVVIVAPPPGGGGNLANMTFESGGFDGLTDGGGGAPVNAKNLTTDAFSGTHAFDVNLGASNNDQGGSGYWVGPVQYSDLWVSFALRVISSPNQGLATQKMVIFRNTGGSPNQFGEMNQIGGQWIWNWLFTDPSKGNIYLTSKFGSVTAGLGQWHTYKLHLQSHGTTTITFSKDGVDNLITLTTAAAPAGIPTTLTFGGTLNAGSGASHFQFDNIHIGTVDPGWP